MSDQLVLVTGAAGGQQGRTGRQVTEMLLERGNAVRAFVHRIDDRSDRLRALGAEVFVGDLLDSRSVERAVRDVGAIYFAYPVQVGLMDATAIMAVAARHAGVRRLINLVMLRSSPDAPTARMRQNFLAEQIFNWAGVGAAHVRAAVFYENLLTLIRPSLANQGAVRLPWGSDLTVVPLVSAEDVACIATHLLASADLRAGSSYPMIGAVLTPREITETLSGVLGVEVPYEQISDEEWRHDAVAQGLNPHAIEHLSALWQSFRAQGFSPEPVRFEVTKTTERLVGIKARTFKEFVLKERSTLTMAPGLSAELERPNPCSTRE
ncbi:MAG: NmrA family NAD(P)-binding protein [Acidiferrobacterales bacterium]